MCEGDDLFCAPCKFGSTNWYIRQKVKMPSKWIQASENKTSNDNALTEQIEPQLNNETAITQFKESANVVTQEISGHDYLERISNPFVDQTPIQVLERVYRLTSITWTPGMANQNYTFPNLLVNTVVANYLLPFRYFRGGVKLQIRMNSTPYHQGALMVSTLPTIDASVGSTTTLWNKYVLSGFKPVVLSASTQDSCVIDLPYLNPVPWLSVLSLGSSSAIGTIVVSELNELTSTSPSVPTSVELTVFASFTNPRVAQYNETVAAQSSRQSRFAVVPVPSGMLPLPDVTINNSVEVKKKNKDGVDSKGVQKIVGGVSEIIKMIPIVGDIYRPIANFISTYAKNLDMPTDTAVSTMVQQYPFQYQNNVRGLYQGDKFTMYPQSATSMDSFAMESSEMSVTELAMVPMLAYQFTPTNQGDTFNIDVHPMDASMTTANFSCDYLAFVAGHFEYWRGSIKYMFHFISSAFYSARFQIAYQLNAGSLIDANLPSQIIDVKGDTIVEITIPFLWNTYWRKSGILGTANLLPTLQIRMITPIAGSSDPSTPFIYLNVWRSAGEDMQFALLKGSQSSLPWTPATSTKTTTITTGVTQPRAQTSVCSRFQQKFAPINESAQFSSELGNCMPECALTVKDVLRRFSLLDPRNWQSAADFSYPYSLPFYSANFFAEPFSAFSNIFLFWRGARRFRVLTNFCDKVVLNSLDASFTPTPGSGQVITNFNVTDPNNPFIALKNMAPPPTKTEFEVPFFSEVPYLHIYRPVVPFSTTILYDLPVGITVNQYNSTLLPPQLTWSAGDDFQYLYLIPPIFPAPTRAVKVRDSKHTKS